MSADRIDDAETMGDRTSNRVLKGRPLIGGAHSGPLYILESHNPAPEPDFISLNNVAGEVERMRHAFLMAKGELLGFQEWIREQIAPSLDGILSEQIRILDDSAFLEEAIRIVESKHYAAEFACFIGAKSWFTSYQRNGHWTIPDEDSLEDLAQFILKHLRFLSGIEEEDVPGEEGAVIFTDNLCLIRTVTLVRRKIGGLVLKTDRPKPETLQLMENCGIPAVAGVKENLDLVKNPVPCFLDGDEGILSLVSDQ